MNEYNFRIEVWTIRTIQLSCKVNWNVQSSGSGVTLCIVAAMQRLAWAVFWIYYWKQYTKKQYIEEQELFNVLRANHFCLNQDCCLLSVWVTSRVAEGQLCLSIYIYINNMLVFSYLVARSDFICQIHIGEQSTITRHLLKLTHCLWSCHRIQNYWLWDITWNEDNIS